MDLLIHVHVIDCEGSRRDDCFRLQLILTFVIASRVDGRPQARASVGATRDFRDCLRERSGVLTDHEYGRSYPQSYEARSTRKRYKLSY